MSGSVSEALMQGLTRRPQIEYLDLDGNILTGLLDNLLSVSIQYKLRHLYVGNTDLSESDVRSIAMAARANNLPNLRRLEYFNLHLNWSGWCFDGRGQIIPVTRL